MTQRTFQGTVSIDEAIDHYAGLATQRKQDPHFAVQAGVVAARLERIRAYHPERAGDMNSDSCVRAALMPTEPKYSR
jgi:hypothetical protein